MNLPLKNRKFQTRKTKGSPILKVPVTEEAVLVH